MLSYTGLRNLYTTVTENTTSGNLTNGDLYINQSIRTICNLRGGKLRFLEATKDMTTVADQEGYQIPNQFRKLIDLYIYSGSGASTDSIYSPEMVFDPVKWKRIKQFRYGTSDVPRFTYVENQKYYIQPIPATTGNKITLRGRKNVRDLSIADYTTGTITSIANGGTAVVGSGTTWTADMVGRYIRITETSAANGGDGFWYEIGSYTSATSIGLLKPYEGTTIAAGTAAYAIGQMSPIPEAYEMAIIYRSAAIYWAIKDPNRATQYWKLYDGGNEQGLINTYGGIIGQMLENEGETEEGSYIPPFASTSPLVFGSYYDPDQQATGF